MWDAHFSSHVASLLLGQVWNQRKGGDGLVTVSSSFHSYRLGQISGEVNVISSEHSQVEGQQLQRNHTQDALEAVHGGRQLDRLIRKLGTFSIVLGAQYNGATLAGRDLLQGILAFGKARILHDDHDDWHLLVNQCQGPVLQLPSQDAF